MGAWRVFIKRRPFCIARGQVRQESGARVCLRTEPGFCFPSKRIFSVFVFLSVGAPRSRESFGGFALLFLIELVDLILSLLPGS